MKHRQTLEPTNGTHKAAEQHELPEALYRRLVAERDTYTARAREAQAEYQRRVQLLIDGYAAALNPEKNYTLSADLKSLIEVDG